jgi:hypothetical protein
MSYEKESEIIVFEITRLLFGRYPILKRKEYHHLEYPSEYVTEYAFKFAAGAVTAAFKTSQSGYERALEHVLRREAMSVI